MLFKIDILKKILEEKAEKYNNINFIKTDPIQIPHFFSKKNDIEIAGFLTSIISWGKRQIIIRNAKKLLELMDNSPYDFIMNYQNKDLLLLNKFKHRTTNFVDIKYFFYSLRNIYKKYNGLEKLFYIKKNEFNTINAILRFRKIFFSLDHEKRTEKHISNPINGSASKKLNMYLRWMIRKDKNKVDFGIWKKISQSKLSIPLDIHTGNVARKLGILNRKKNDIKSVIILDNIFRSFDKKDPVKYDFALFGLGVFEKF